jgi:flagellar FliJ protein
MATFPLAALLRLRRLREDQAAASVGRARSRASQLAAQRGRLIDTLSDRDSDTTDIRGIAAMAAARASAAVMLSDLEGLRQAQERAVDEAEGEHRTARREAAVVQKLEERHGEQERARELSAEQAALDELAGRPAPGDGGTA